MSSILRSIPAERSDLAAWVEKAQPTYFAVKGKVKVSVGDYVFVVWKNKVFAVGLVEDIESNGKRRLDFLNQGHPPDPEAYIRLYVYRLFKFGRPEAFQSFTGVRYVHRAYSQRDWCRQWTKANRLIGKPIENFNYGKRGRLNDVSSKHKMIATKMLTLAKSFKDLDKKRASKTHQETH